MYGFRMTTDDFTRAESAAQFITSQTSVRPKIALVLGSGLGAFADALTDAVRISYAQIPSFPRSTAIGHAGQLVIGKVTQQRRCLSRFAFSRAWASKPSS